MSKLWPTVRLGEVLRRSEETIELQPDASYRQITVRLWGKGVTLRGILTGAEIASSRQMVARRGQFILSRIDARNGALGIVPSELDEAIVTNDFPVFNVVENRMLPTYLGWMCRTASFVEECKRASEGTTNRVRLQEDKFLAREIPLPPLAEQRRVVARIEELAAQIHEARTLRHQAAEEAEALHLSVLHQHFAGEMSKWTPMPMDEAIEINDKQVDPTLSEFSQLPHISGENMESKTCRLLPWRTAEADGVKSNNYLFSPGTILYSKIRPYLRKAVFVDFRGVCSADVYPVRVKSPMLEPQFVKWALIAEPFTEYANRLSGRTRMPKLNRKQLFGFDFTHPPLAEQRRIVAELAALQAEVDALKRLQAETAAELDALLPAILDKAFKGEL
jgi:type I restriction enzyme S subunit